MMLQARSARQETFDEEISALKAALEKLIDRVAADSRKKRSMLQALADQAIHRIKAYPMAAIALAAGLGYVVGRL